MVALVVVPYNNGTLKYSWLCSQNGIRHEINTSWSKREYSMGVETNNLIEP